jgi:hypothetical protein
LYLVITQQGICWRRPKSQSIQKLKVYLKNKYFSITLDHWTSIANESYGALTLHVIEDCTLKAFILSCVKHPNGCSAVEMKQQLIKDVEKWELVRPYFICCVTDTASYITLFGQKLQVWNDANHLRHHYCADHVLQLTAVKAYSGNINLNVGSEDNSVLVIRKVRDLVSHVNSSSVTAEKLRSVQHQNKPSGFIYKLMPGCETRWWSTLLMIERAFELKEALKDLFEDEFRFRESANTPTTLESLRLSDDDFDSLKDLIYILSPFKRAQKALEGEKYVNISLLPSVIKELYNQLELTQGAIDPDEQEDLYKLIRNDPGFQEQMGRAYHLSFNCGARRKKPSSWNNYVCILGRIIRPMHKESPFQDSKLRSGIAPGVV